MPINAHIQQMHVDRIRVITALPPEVRADFGRLFNALYDAFDRKELGILYALWYAHQIGAIRLGDSGGARPFDNVSDEEMRRLVANAHEEWWAEHPAA
jgi:hypothetical protein